jgi:hypothetical protein
MQRWEAEIGLRDRERHRRPKERNHTVVGSVQACETRAVCVVPSLIREGRPSAQDNARQL